MIIEPSPGRIVWFWKSKDQDFIAQHDETQPLAAIVTCVWNTRMVNLRVFDQNGGAHPVTSVTLVQEGDFIPSKGITMFCEWMPYQRSVAKGEILPSIHAQPKRDE